MSNPAHLLYNVVIFVPVTHADIIREALSDAKGGTMEDGYDSCTFSCRGLTRFRPLHGANPAIGTIGSVEIVEEERIEVTVLPKYLTQVLTAVTSKHPYEKPCILVQEVKNYVNYLNG